MSFSDTPSAGDEQRPESPTPGILASFRVIDLAGDALTYAGRIFAELGAEVTMVEPPGGSPARHQEPLVETDSGPVSAHFAFMAMGKRSVIMDINSAEDAPGFERLVGDADVVLLPDQDLEHGTDDLATRVRSINPRAVVVAATAFGLTGPRRHWRGSDQIAWASSGVTVRIGDPDRPPLAPGGGLGNVATSLNGAVGALMALRARRRTNRGELVDISMQEAVLSISMESGPLLVLEGLAQQRSVQRHMPAHGTFPASDGMVEIGAYLPAQWDSTATWISEELGAEEATMDTFKGPQLKRVEFADLINTWVSELTSKRTKREVFLEAQRRGIPSGPVNSSVDLLDDPHLTQTSSWTQVPHPDTGRFRMPRGPLTFDGNRMTNGPVPRAGQHNDEVLDD
jgi:benzylsuccinate CoA-transferase BbsE subunit